MTAETPGPIGSLAGECGRLHISWTGPETTCWGELSLILARYSDAKPGMQRRGVASFVVGWNQEGRLGIIGGDGCAIGHCYGPEEGGQVSIRELEVGNEACGVNSRQNYTRWYFGQTRCAFGACREVYISSCLRGCHYRSQGNSIRILGSRTPVPFGRPLAIIPFTPTLPRQQCGSTTSSRGPPSEL